MHSTWLRLVWLGTWVVSGLTASAPQGPATSESVLLLASAAKVWADLGSASGLQRAFGVVHAEVDLAAGRLRTHHDPKAKPDDPATLVLEVVAMDPERLLVMRLPAVANAEAAPRSAALALRLEPLGPDRCRLWVTRSAWRLDGERSRHLLLAAGNPWTLADVQAAYGKGYDPSAPGPVQTQLQQLVGGTWMAWQGTNGVRRSCQVRVGATVEIEEARGTGDSQTPYARIVVSRDNSIEAMVFTAWRGDGSLVRGHLRLPQPGLLEFAGQTADGREDRQTWLLRGGTLTDQGERLVFERKDAIPAKLR